MEGGPRQTLLDHVRERISPAQLEVILAQLQDEHFITYNSDHIFFGDD